MQFLLNSKRLITWPFKLVSFNTGFGYTPAYFFESAGRDGLATSAGKPLHGLSAAILTERQYIWVIILTTHMK